MPVPEGLKGREGAARRLLRSAGLRPPYTFRPVPEGRNNRVFVVEGENGRAVLKAYFHHPQDPRDRLKAEYEFLSLAKGLPQVPRPIARDPKAHLGLYEHVPGRRLRPGEVRREHVRQALDLFAAVNERRGAAKRLGTASEARFTIVGHLDLVGGRVARLSGISGGSAEHARARAFVETKLRPAWSRARERTLEAAVRAGLDPEAPLPKEDRRLSPSDFGFHNALLGPDGRLRFVDFEYSGWDDPAKTAGDFFSQPAVPAPKALFGWFCEGLAEGMPDAEAQRRRMALLRKAYALKWVCIMLNDFLPVSAERRRFAGGRRPAEQLAKAQKALRELERP